jgi:hypothetical protein
MKKFVYTFFNKVCPIHNKQAVEEFWIENSFSIERSGCHCPECKMLFYFQVTPDPNFLKRVNHILLSEEKQFIRTVRDTELIKKHGVSAEWFCVGRKVYVDTEDMRDKEVTSFSKKNKARNKVLVYLPNSHLQRLYFFVPKNAIA